MKSTSTDNCNSKGLILSNMGNSHIVLFLWQHLSVQGRQRHKGNKKDIKKTGRTWTSRLIWRRYMKDLHWYSPLWWVSVRARERNDFVGVKESPATVWIPSSPTSNSWEYENKKIRNMQAPHITNIRVSIDTCSKRTTKNYILQILSKGDMKLYVWAPGRYVSRKLPRAPRGCALCRLGSTQTWNILFAFSKLDSSTLDNL